jgi:hypothetical protein
MYIRTVRTTVVVEGWCGRWMFLQAGRAFYSVAIGARSKGI